MSCTLDDLVALNKTELRMLPVDARVLIVDDNAANLKLMGVVLRQLKFEVREASDGVGALEILTSFSPNLVLSDIDMPGMSGIELAARIRAERPDLRLVAVSAHANPEHREEAFGAGFSGFITKPIDTRTIGDSLRQILLASVEGEHR